MKELGKNEMPVEMIQDEEASSEIETLRKRLEEKEKEVKENYDRILRTSADFDNYRKRAVREKEDLVKFANEKLIKAILPFIDNLEKALDHSQKTQDIRSLVEGVKLTRDQVFRTLKEFGLSTVQSLRSPFDPAVHEAMMVVETDHFEANQVVEEFLKGYLLHDRLIRPAMVSVSKPPQIESGAERAHRMQLGNNGKENDPPIGESADQELLLREELSRQSKKSLLW